MNVKVNVRTHSSRLGHPMDWARITITEELAVDVNRLAGALKLANAVEIVVVDIFEAQGRLLLMNPREIDKRSCQLVVRNVGHFYWRGRFACCGVDWEIDPIPFSVLIDPSGTADLDLREHREDQKDVQPLLSLPLDRDGQQEPEIVARCVDEDRLPIDEASAPAFISEITRFVQKVAGLKRWGEPDPDQDGQPFHPVEGLEDSHGCLMDLIEEARKLMATRLGGSNEPAA